MTMTDSGVARLHRVWETRSPPSGLPLSEQQYTALAELLALRQESRADSILDAEYARITDPDRRARFVFVRPSLSPDPSVRDALFERLRDVEHRRRESWVLDAMYNLNHPLRARHARRYIEPGLALVEEIQRTGDIFFPINWMDALLGGHNSVEAAEMVVAFLDSHRDMQPRLRGKLLQVADDVFRSARIVHGWKGEALPRIGMR
jgi:aminopeptidase N